MMRAMDKRLHRRLAATLVVVAALLFVRCASGPAAVAGNSSIVVGGERFDIGTRVVLWDEPGAYDAYHLPPHKDGKERFGKRTGDPQTLAALQQTVHTFVLHFDECGTSRRCFEVLRDRGLSVHFLLDVDGTIYQTLDLKERAFHATIANDFGVGIEIAHPGHWPQPLNADMRRWYEKDEQGWRMKFPGWMKEPGVRTPDFVARPARPEFVAGEIHGKTWYQFDYTPQQYAALARLCAGLHRALPRIALDYPRDGAGEVLRDKLDAERLRAFDGIVGHYHVQDNKTDPGPALQWERVIAGAAAAAR